MVVSDKAKRRITWGNRWASRHLEVVCKMRSLGKNTMQKNILKKLDLSNIRMVRMRMMMIILMMDDNSDDDYDVEDDHDVVVIVVIIWVICFFTWRILCSSHVCDLKAPLWRVQRIWGASMPRKNQTSGSQGVFMLLIYVNMHPSIINQLPGSQDLSSKPFRQTLLTRTLPLGPPSSLSKMQSHLWEEHHFLAQQGCLEIFSMALLLPRPVHIHIVCGSKKPQVLCEKGSVSHHEEVKRRSNQCQQRPYTKEANSLWQLQLGIQCAAAREFYGKHEAVVTLKVWFTMIKSDR